MRGFEAFHPLLLFLYYALILVISMVTMHPVVLTLSLLGGLLLYGAQKDLRTFLEDLLFFFLLFIFMSFINPLFVHNGETVLFYMNGQAITKEAMLYGVMSSEMILGVLIWCSCYSRILTTDKFLYLFGRTIPKMGLVLSMTFRFIPLFTRQIKTIALSQKTMGLYPSDSVSDRVRGGIRTFDSLVSWSLENSVDTADAMRARGYGLPGRTTFTLFRFTRGDGILLGIMAVLTLFVLAAAVNGSYTYFYYPYTKALAADAGTLLGGIPAALLFMLPGIIEWKERILWNS